MSRYRRSHAAGSAYFFTVALAERASSALVQQIETLRAAYGQVQRDTPFHTIAICILPDHLHAAGVGCATRTIHGRSALSCRSWTAAFG